MTDLAGSDSLRSASTSSDNSTELYTSLLFPDCEHLNYVKKLSEAKFPVYLVYDNKRNQYYAIKIFPWEDDSPISFFQREIKFRAYTHPNIVNIVGYVEEQQTYSEECPIVSYLLMEYAKYGDLFDAIVTYRIPFPDTILRTYFHQLINGLDVLHSSGAAHLDLKLENLLINHEYILKITDFDLSFTPEDRVVKTKGTRNFRAPELLEERCTDPQAADIYSAGIILYLMKTGGMIPWKEERSPNSFDMKQLKESNPDIFWKKQLEILGKRPSFFEEDFKELFMKMTDLNPKKRPTVKQIKASKWFNKEICSEEELFVFMNGRFEFL